MRLRPVRPLLACLLVAVVTAASAAAPAVRWGAANRQPAAWYASAEARAIAASVVQYQTEEGGWPKNHDMTEPPTGEFLRDGKFDHRHPTIDNGATTSELEFLARVLTAGGDPALRAAFDRGFEYLLAAQYPNGGWPQYFPLVEGYYTHITYNDNAMVNVLDLLRDLARGEAPYAFGSADQRARADAAVRRGIDCILRTQVRQDGKLTAWCAQHDEKTLAPAWARRYEPPSLSGGESVGIVRFLMGEKNPTPEIIAAVEGAVAWFTAVKITGWREDHPANPALPHKFDRVMVADPSAPPIWARFYELGTNRPIYLGRDSVVHYRLDQVELERRGGYRWHLDEPLKLIERDYPRWREKNKLP